MTSRQLREHIVGRPLLPCPACGAQILYVTSTAAVVCLRHGCPVAPWPAPRIAYEVDIVDGLARERVPGELEFGTPFEVIGTGGDGRPHGTWVEYLPARAKGKREWRRMSDRYAPLDRTMAWR